MVSLYFVIRDWSKGIAWWGSRKGCIVQFSAAHGGGSFCFLTGFGTQLTQSTTEVTPSSSKALQTFSR